MAQWTFLVITNNNKQLNQSKQANKSSCRQVVHFFSLTARIRFSISFHSLSIGNNNEQLFWDFPIQMMRLRCIVIFFFFYFILHTSISTFKTTTTKSQGKENHPRSNLLHHHI